MMSRISDSILRLKKFIFNRGVAVTSPRSGTGAAKRGLPACSARASALATAERLPNCIGKTLEILAVLFGGAAGAVCRFELNAAVVRAVGAGFPYGILLINTLGGFLMGLLQGAIKRSGSPHALVYSLLGTGFLGGFTTFSTFSLDTLTLFQAGHPLAAGLNIGLNAVVCVLAAGFGYAVSGASSH